MVFVFWQGIISIHQKAFLEALAIQPAASKVLLVVAEAITPYRKDMGWEVPKINGVEVITAPAKNDITQLVTTYKDAVHIIGGIRVGDMLSTALDECIRLKCKLGIMTEPYNKEGIKGLLRSYKYSFYKLRYARHIQFVLAIGRQGVNQFIDHGFNGEKVFPWAYFISLPQAAPHIESATDIRRIIYAGRIEENKGIYRFTEELINTGAKNYAFDIYGTGPDEQKLKQLITTNNLAGQIKCHPFLPHDELLEKYAEYDWVVLPSSGKDGWGVIVSEGLLNGLKAICSNICGVSWVVTDGYNGVVFDWAAQGSCTKAIDAMLRDKKFADADTISNWANDTISGEAGAKYFIKIMDKVYAGKQRPGIPWL